MISAGAIEVAMNTGEGTKFTMYLKDIEKAMLNVDTVFYCHQKKNTDEDGFTGEFIHQLRAIQDQKLREDNHSPYRGVIWNYNQDKEEAYYLSLISNYLAEKQAREEVSMRNHAILLSRDNLEKTIRPDFILHTPDNLDRQEIYGEIKMQGNQETLADLDKITEWKNILEEAYASDEYLENDLDPRYGLYIFIYVYIENQLTPTGLPSDDSLKARISRKEDRDAVQTYDRDIICFSLIDGNNRRVVCQTLGEILDEIDWYINKEQ